MRFLKKGGSYTIFRGTGGGGELGGPAAGGSCGCSSLYIALPFTLQILFSSGISASLARGKTITAELRDCWRAR